MFVCLFARIEAPMWDFQFGFNCGNLIGGPAVFMSFHWHRRSDGGTSNCVSSAVIWLEVLLFVCLSASIDALMGNFQLVSIAVILLEVLLFVSFR